MYYGWIIVFAGLLMISCNGAILIYGFTAFIEPIALSFGWSYTQISLASSLRGIEMGALNPVMGILIDRFPVKRLALSGVILYGLGLLGLSRVNNLAMFYICFLFLGLGNSLGFSMVPQTTVVRWFKRDLGKATGLLFMGAGIGGLFLPALVLLIDTHGWRNALVFLAAGMLAICIPLSFVFRTRPEDYGLSPDGKRGQQVNGPDGTEAPESGKNVKEVLRMRAFWQIGLGTMCQVTPLAAVITHIMPYFASIGLERSVAGVAAMGIPLVSLFARVPFGWLSDIYDKRHIRAISIGFVSVGLFLFWLIDSASFGLIILFVIFTGLGSGGVMSTQLPLFRAYFGTKHFGTVLGLANVFMTIGVIIGPPLAGRVYDTLGSFAPIWLFLSATAALGAIITATSPPLSKNVKQRAANI